MDKGWCLEDIAWHALQREKAPESLVAVIKTASLVEYNSPDYERYLCNIFHTQDMPHELIRRWAQEERQHGKALAAWATAMDPSFDLEVAAQRFQKLFRVPLDTSSSLRGCARGELVARCVVESGTSSFYTALAKGTQEPVLQQICRYIAADEFRHYKLFYSHLQRLLRRKPLSLWRRLRIALGRLMESQSHELASAYHAANVPEGVPYAGVSLSKTYISAVGQYYEPHHVRRALAMILKASGISPQNPLTYYIGQGAWYIFSWRNGGKVAEPGPAYGAAS